MGKDIMLLHSNKYYQHNKTHIGGLEQKDVTLVHKQRSNVFLALFHLYNYVNMLWEKLLAQKYYSVGSADVLTIRPSYLATHSFSLAFASSNLRPIISHVQRPPNASLYGCILARKQEIKLILYEYLHSFLWSLDMCKMYGCLKHNIFKVPI